MKAQGAPIKRQLHYVDNPWLHSASGSGDSIAIPRPLLWFTAAIVVLSIAAAALVPVEVQDAPDRLEIPTPRQGDSGTYALFDAKGEAIGLWSFRLVGPLPAGVADGSQRAVLLIESEAYVGSTTVSLGDHVDRVSRTSVRLDAGQAEPGFREVVTGFDASEPVLPGLGLAGLELRKGSPVPPAPGVGAAEIPVPWWHQGPSDPPRLTHPALPRDGQGASCIRNTAPQITGGGSLDGAPALSVVVSVDCGGERLQQALWFTESAPVAAQATYGQPGGGPSVVAALVAFERGHGALLPWLEEGGQLAPPPSANTQNHSPGAPPTGDATAIPYPLEAALEDVRGDRDLTDFQVYRSLHPDAKLVSARLSRGEHSWEEVESYTWRFLFAAPDGAGHQVATEWTRHTGTVNTSDRGPVDVPAAALDQLPTRSISLTDALAIWRAIATQPYAERTPNYVHWGLDVPFTWAPDCDHVPTDTGRLPSTPGMDRVIVGYSTYGTCVTPKVERLESSALVDLQNGTVDRLVEHRVHLAAFPEGGVHRSEASIVEPVPEGALLEPPWLEIAAATTTSLLALLWGVYFWPAIKFALAQTTMAVRGYSRISSDELLEHPTRQGILDLLDGTPGLTASEITEQLDIGWSTLAHHTRLLAGAGLLDSRMVGRHRHFFLPGRVEPDERDALALLRSPATRRVYERMVDEPGLSLAELAGRLEMTPAGALWHVRRLEQAGLASRERDGREVRCLPHPAPEEG